MEQPVLTDKHTFPSEEVIFSHIGKAKSLWSALFDHIHVAYPDFAEDWNYYLDGKSWLLKVSRKKKTVFWLSVLPGTFRTTFYFTAKAAGQIQESNLSSELKKQFSDPAKHGKIRGVTLVYTAQKDVEEAKKLIRLKLNMK